MTKLQQTILNITVPLVLTLFGSVAVLEFGFRTFYQVIPLEVCASDFIIGNYYCQPYFQYDKPIKIAYRYQPDLQLEGYWDPANPFLGDAGQETRPSDRSDPFWYVLETDEMGFPNSADTWQDQYDIIVTGDSFSIRTAPTTWIETLDAQTEGDVLTLGAPSWTTMNEVEAVKQFGLDKNPNWVVLTYFEGNDMINVQQYLDKQATGLDWREYDMQNTTWLQRQVLYHMTRHWLGFNNTGEAETAEPDYRYPVEVNSEAGKFDAVLKDIHLYPISADADTIRNSDEFKATQDYLLDLKTTLEAQEARLLIVYIPSKAHTYWSRIWDPEDINNILERTVTVRLSEGDHGRMEWDPTQILTYDQFNANHIALETVFGEFMAEHQFDYINLTPLFWQETISNGETYHYVDPHWNQYGNDLVGQIVADYINDPQNQAVDQSE